MNYETPYLKGESKLVFDPKLPGSNESWFINDHCFIEDFDGIIHNFSINNPYPPEGKKLYSYHPYIGHAISSNPLSKWERQDFVFDEINGTEYLGAPYVILVPDKKMYAMIFESKIDGRRCLELAWSKDLFSWERTGKRINANWPDATRDPCIIRNDEGIFSIYLSTPDENGSTIMVTQTTDFQKFSSPVTCLQISDGATWSGVESPFILKRKDLCYLFFTYAHRHYYETVVCVSDQPDHFSLENIVTTLYGHAAEIFNYKGKPYISSCGPEDRQALNKHGLYLSELGWVHDM